jgi:hypothetical protein
MAPRFRELALMAAHQSSATAFLHPTPIPDPSPIEGEGRLINALSARP